MPNSWVAVDAGIDPRSWARLLRRAYNRAVGGGAAPRIVRDVVADSWVRSERAGVDPRERAPIMVERPEAAHLFLRHRLAPLLHLVESVLVEVAVYAHQVVTIADRDGLVLWTGGHADALQAAERIHLMPGVLWSEEVVGTNALGTSLVLDHPLQIFAAEHFKQSTHGWSSSAAPVHDPETRDLLGAVTLSGPVDAAHPHGFSLVVATAQILEAHLEHLAAQRDERLKVEYLERVVCGCPEASAVVNHGGQVLLSMPPGWLGRKLRISPEGVPIAPAAEEVRVEPLAEGYLVLRGAGAEPAALRPKLRLEVLGRARALVTLDGRSLDLSLRHSEILVILAEHPDGMTEQELASALYGTPIKSVTIRAEISRLHKLLGAAIRTRPYRLAADVTADFLEPAADVDAELLPSSEAPAIVARRRRAEGDTAGAAG
jgi:hypothetical protein